MNAKLVRLAAASLAFGLLQPSAAIAQDQTVTWFADVQGPGTAVLHGLDASGSSRFMAWCEPAAVGRIYARFSGNTSGISLGEVVTAGIQGTGGSVQEAVGLTNGATGPEFYVEAAFDAPIWRVLAGSTYLVMSTRGGPFATLANIDTNAASKLITACTPAQTTVAEPVSPQQPEAGTVQPAIQQQALIGGGRARDDGSLSVGEGIALGVLGFGAAILANEVAEEFFSEAGPPEADGEGDGRRLRVQITSVRAIETTFGFGGDEIFLLFSNGERFPRDNAQEIDEGEVWSPGAVVESRGAVSVDLREWDSFNASDQIGNLSISADQGEGRFTQTLRGDGAVYEINYEVALVRDRQRQTQPIPQQQPSQQQPQRPSREWAAHNANAEITVTDCRDDCEEDIGIIMMCRGDGLPAEVQVPWVGTETGPAGRRSSVSIVLGNQAYVYDATLGNYGLVGHVPSFFINPHDPVIDALQAGSVADIVFEGQSARIGLKGSRSALEIFKAHCGWNNVPFGTQFADGLPVSQQPEPRAEPFWFTTAYADPGTGRTTNTLIFGIPETDAVGFSASCLSGGGDITADLVVDFGTLGDGASASTYVQAGGQTFQHQGKVFISSSEWAGVSIALRADDPVWNAMASAPQSIAYGMIGGGGNVTPIQGARQAIGQFVAACGVSTPPQRRVVQQPVQQRPIQQGVQQPIPQGVQQPIRRGGQQPIRQGVQQPIEQTPQGQPSNYTCSDGTSMAITRKRVANGIEARISRGGRTPFTLTSTALPLGASFTDGVAVLTSRGASVRFTAPGIDISCQLAP